MKNNSRLISIGFAFLVLTVLFGSAGAQDRERYVISAKAGGINIATGDVTVKRRGATDWQQLTSKDELVAGDTVKSGSDGRAEVLLNPGSYLRIAENSEFEFTDPSLDSLRLKIVKGSALVEVTGDDETKALIEVNTPQSRTVIDRRGLYRINVSSSNRTELLVRKGRALIRRDATLATTVKDGQLASVSGGQVVVTKFEKHDEDAFDAWSQQRGEALVAANSQLSQRAIARNYSRYGSGFGRWGYGSHGGLWVFGPSFGYHTFFPFYGGWSSPYGHHYRHGFGISPFGHFGGGFGFGGRHGSVASPRHGVGRVGGRLGTRHR